eukprot:g44917.t1
MRLQEFFHKPQDVSSEPNETTNELEQSTEICSAATKEERFELDSSERPLAECDPSTTQCNAIQGLKTNRNIVIKPADKLVKTFDPDLQCVLCTLILRIPRIGDFYCLPKIHKANTPGQPIVSGNGTLCENLSDYVKGILKPILQEPPASVDGHLSTSIYCKLTDNLTMLHFSSFHPKHVKEAIPYRPALRIHRICSDEEEHDGHLKILKDALIRMGYDAQLIDFQLRCATSERPQQPPQKTDTGDAE